MESNISLGTKCENMVKDLLREKGYWVYQTPRSQSGAQPVDIICAKSNIIILLDAKHVRKEDISFTLSRIEPNQLSSLNYAKNYAQLKNLGFAIYFERTNTIKWLDYNDIKGQKSVNEKELKTFEEKLKEVEYGNDNF